MAIYCRQPPSRPRLSGSIESARCNVEILIGMGVCTRNAQRHLQGANTESAARLMAPAAFATPPPSRHVRNHEARTCRSPAPRYAGQVLFRHKIDALVPSSMSVDGRSRFPVRRLLLPAHSFPPLTYRGNIDDKSCQSATSALARLFYISLIF